MNARTRQYLFGLIFFAVGVYQLVQKDFLEATLYMLAGAAFVCNTLTSEPRFAAQKKVWVIITWVLIAATGVMFLYLIQFKYM